MRKTIDHKKDILKVKIETSKNKTKINIKKKHLMNEKKGNVSYRQLTEYIYETYRFKINIASLKRYIKKNFPPIKSEEKPENKIKTIFGETKLYPLNKTTNPEKIRKLLYEAPQAQILKTNNIYYVATNGTVLQNLQSLFILNETNSTIPKELM